MDKAFLEHLGAETEALKSQGLFKSERVITSPQRADIDVGEGQVLNFCANNYLGLANHRALRDAAKEGIDKYGFGMASVRFICGTQDIHKTLESRLSAFLGTEDTILYSSGFDANGGLFETLLGPDDAVISDQLNHASIIDGIRLCKAKRYRYANNDMADLEAKLQQAQRDGAKTKIIATDGVFSMDGYIADLGTICDLAEKYGALTMIDDCHATGFVGLKGRGTPEHCGVLGRIDIITGTLGKALGGASGGFTSGRREIVGWLRQRSRPYLFSKKLAPVIAYTSIVALDLLESGDELREKLRWNTQYFRDEMAKLGFEILPGEHPIIPVMLGDAKLASDMADRLLDEGIYVVGFSFPVVPKGQARIRTQMSAAHDQAHLDRAIAAFAKVGRDLGVIE
ncbi:MAG: glycine C-acetyltransferase [Myxococcota bacterium]|nr:glycine C-acetyltransferase [Myxococcota bacterium]